MIDKLISLKSFDCFLKNSQPFFSLLFYLHELYCFCYYCERNFFKLFVYDIIIMTKIPEWDDRVKFKEQIEEKGIDGHVVLINKFIVEPDKAEQFLKDWTEDAKGFKQQPGFISTQMHKGIGRSSVFLNYAVWESLDHYKEAVNKRLFSSEPLSPLMKYDDTLIMSPHLFKKIAVHGICGE